MWSNILQLNHDRNKVLLVSGRCDPGFKMPPILDGDALPLHSLGVLFDQDQLLDKQVAALTKGVCYQLKG